MRPLIVGLIGVLAAAGCATKSTTERPARKPDVAARAPAEPAPLDEDEILLGILLLPEAEQAPKWRTWARTERSEALRSEALSQLAAVDPQDAVTLAVADLDSELPSRRTHALGVLAAIGLPAAKPALAALARRPKDAAFVRLRVALGDRSAAPLALALFRKQPSSIPLSAFDDSTFVELARDPDPAISTRAAAALTRSNDPRALEALRSLLAQGGSARWKAIGEIVNAEVGGAGWLTLLGALPRTDAASSWYATETALRSVRALADPRAADALSSFIESKPHAHFRTQASLALAEIGDLRALPGLAERLELDPLVAYGEGELELPLRRDDSERVQVARVIADLAELHPTEHARLRSLLEKPLFSWMRSRPIPHANALRALTAIGSARIVADLVRFADPQRPLPKPGQQPPFPEEWMTAQSALRYLGRARSPRSLAILEKQLDRRPKNFDGSQEALLGGGAAILGMTLRALGIGASQGLAEARDPNGAAALSRFASDEKQHEQARIEACAALGAVADAALVDSALTQLEQAHSKPGSMVAACALETLMRSRFAFDGTRLTALLADPSFTDTALRNGAARALARARHDPARLEALIGADERGVAPALTLLLSGNGDFAVRAVSSLASCGACMSQLEAAWTESLLPVTRADFEARRVHGWATVAERLARVKLAGKRHDFALRGLVAAFENWSYDAGPGTITRNVARVELSRDARADARRLLRLITGRAAPRR